jgi:predicted transcriptional regulator
MVKQGYPIRDIVAALGRTESAVRQHVYKLGLVLRGRKRRY